MDAFKILFVDDEIDFLETLMKRMKKRGVGVSGVGSGENALKFLDDKPADVVVLDVKMPGMDGIEVLKIFKKAYPEMAVIMLTGHGSEKAAKEGIEFGAFDYLTKPCELEDLIEKIHEAIAKGR